MFRIFITSALALSALPVAAQELRTLQLDQPVTGTLSETDPTLGDDSYFHVWLFRADPGTRVRILLTSTAFDTYLSVGTLDGDAFETSASNDDFDPPGTDSRLDATVPASGTLHVRVNSFSAGETGAYQLALSMAPNAAVGGVRPMAVATVSGAEFVDGELMTRPGGAPAHFWRFEAVAGERYAIAMYSPDVDCYLSIGHGDGEAFTSLDDNDDSDGGTDSRIIFEAETTGPVIIRASTFGTETGPYRLSIQRLPPAMD